MVIAVLRIDVLVLIVVAKTAFIAGVIGIYLVHAEERRKEQQLKDEMRETAEEVYKEEEKAA